MKMQMSPNRGHPTEVTQRQGHPETKMCACGGMLVAMLWRSCNPKKLN